MPYQGAREGLAHWLIGNKVKPVDSDMTTRSVAGTINKGGRTRGRVKRLASAQRIDASGRDVQGSVIYILPL